MQTTAAAAEAVVVGGFQLAVTASSSSGRMSSPSGAEPLVSLDHPVVQHLGQDDPPVEDPRPVLVGDAQGVGETFGDDQDGRLALALEQRVGGHGRAQPDRADPLGREPASGPRPSSWRMPATAASR
jgi:hypothetical protein